MDPKNKIALVTGAAQGIGLGIVKVLLRQGGIKAVSICDINVTKAGSTIQQLEKEFGKNRAIFIKTDVSKEEEMEAAFKKTVEKFGGLDIVVNNAGFFNDKNWQKCISVNLNGVIKGTILALEYMGKDKGGKGGVVVNMGSIAGVGGGIKVAPMYTATKSGVVGFTRSFESEFLTQTSGVRVMVICPAYTKSEILSEANKSNPTYNDDWMEEFSREFVHHEPPQRTEAVGEGVLLMIRSGKSGSVWITAFDEPVYEINIPPHPTLRV